MYFLIRFLRILKQFRRRDHWEFWTLVWAKENLINKFAEVAITVLEILLRNFTCLYYTKPDHNCCAELKWLLTEKSHQRSRNSLHLLLYWIIIIIRNSQILDRCRKCSRRRASNLIWVHNSRSLEIFVILLIFFVVRRWASFENVQNMKNVFTS